MDTEVYKVKKIMVDKMELEKSLINFCLSEPIVQKIHENRDTYESNITQDELTSNNNIIRKAFVNVVFFERVHQVAFKKVMADSEYRKAEEASSHLFSQLEKSLSTEEQKELLLELESAWDSKYGIFLEHSYCQGIADSPMIHKQLKKYGISVVKETTECNYSEAGSSISMLM
ncbi:hypothetical protein ACA30_09740 [Virgibacillus soli]|nr:hypothetical protein ACA30_09740 [Virgibacillus soli]